MTSTLDLPLGDLIKQHRAAAGAAPSTGSGASGRRQRGGRRNGPRQGGEGAANGEGGKQHPLEREGGGSSSGPIRHGRRERAPRSDPYARDYAYPTEGENWSRGFSGGLAPSAAAAAAPAPALVGDTVRLSNLSPDLREDDLRYIFDKVGAIRAVTIHYDASSRAVGTAEIQFTSQAAAQAAVQNLDQAEVDGRIMYVNLVGQVIQHSVVPAYRGASRYDDRPRDRDYDRDRAPRRDDRDRRGGDERRAGGADRQRGGAQQQRDGGRQAAGGRGGNGGRQAGAAAAGAAAGGEKGKKKAAAREPRVAPKAEDLDAEMDNWHAEAKAKDAQPEAAAAPAAAPAAAEAPMEGGQ